MKTFKPILLFVFFLSLLTISCRQEDDALINTPQEEALVANSNIADLISRTAQNDGSIDNIIDNASCLEVQLPVTVIVNGTQVVINDEDDYQTIEDILDLFDDDVDTVEIVYPITVILEDYTTVVINSDDELIALAQNCPGDNENDDDIECIDIQYPVTVFIFNENNEQIDTIVINNDEEMYDFIEDIDQFAVVVIDFPITVIFFDGSTQQVNSIQQLEDAIETADDTCDEDDDNDYNDDDCDDCTTSDLENLFADCEEWSVDDLERNGEDLEDQYEDFIFSFASDGSISVTGDSTSFSGTWSAEGSGNMIEVTINIPDLPDFNDVWILHEIEREPGEASFDLRKGDDNLEFESDCTSGGGGGTSGDPLSDVLTANNDEWIVGTYLEDGIDETAQFNGFEFTFETTGTVIAMNGSTTINGSWSSLSNGSELLLDFDENEPLDELNDDDWDVISISDTQVELQDVSGGGGGTDTLILIKQ